MLATFGLGRPGGLLATFGLGRNTLVGIERLIRSFISYIVKTKDIELEG